MAARRDLYLDRARELEGRTPGIRWYPPALQKYLLEQEITYCPSSRPPSFLTVPEVLWGGPPVCRDHAHRAVNLPVMRWACATLAEFQKLVDDRRARERQRLGKIRRLQNHVRAVARIVPLSVQPLAPELLDRVAQFETAAAADTLEAPLPDDFDYEKSLREALQSARALPLPQEIRRAYEKALRKDLTGQGLVQTRAIQKLVAEALQRHAYSPPPDWDHLHRQFGLRNPGRTELSGQPFWTDLIHHLIAFLKQVIAQSGTRDFRERKYFAITARILHLASEGEYPDAPARVKARFFRGL